jgi:hypothetical protein
MLAGERNFLYRSVSRSRIMPRFVQVNLLVDTRFDLNAHLEAVFTNAGTFDL